MACLATVPDLVQSEDACRVPSLTYGMKSTLVADVVGYQCPWLASSPLLCINGHENTPPTLYGLYFWHYIQFSVFSWSRTLTRAQDSAIRSAYL